MNIRIIMRGNWLRLWQRFPQEIKSKIGIPKEFYNKDHPNVPAHIGVNGLPIGASGFRLIKCGKGEYHAETLRYDKWGNSIKNVIRHPS